MIVLLHYLSPDLSFNSPGTYTGADGKLTTYTQPPESLGPISTMPYTARIPSSSACSTFSSAALFSGQPSATLPVSGAASSTVASTAAVTTASGSTVTNKVTTSASHSASSTTSASGAAPLAVGNVWGVVFGVVGAMIGAVVAL